jgi:multicomponent Na+:H+ antiporter subunit E
MIGPFVKAAAALAGLHLLLTGNVEHANVAAAVFMGCLVAFLLRPRGRGWGFARMPLALWAIFLYLVLILWDVIGSGLWVARLILTRRPALRTGILAIPSGCRSELGRALSAHALTIAPGEMVVAIDEDGVLYTHCLDADAAEIYAREHQKRRCRLLSRIIPNSGEGAKEA